MQPGPFATSSNIPRPVHILPRVFRAWIDGSFIASLHGNSPQLADAATTVPAFREKRLRRTELREGDATLPSEGVVAFSALRERLRWRGEATSFFGIGFDDGTMFLSKRTPTVYDADNKKLGTVEIPVGSYVKISYRADGKVNWLAAIQLGEVAEEKSPFTAITKNHRN